MAEAQSYTASDAMTAEQIDDQEQGARIDTRSKRVSAFAFWFVFFGIILMLSGLHYTGYLPGLQGQRGSPDAMAPLAVFGIATTAAFFPMWGYLLGSRIGWWLFKK